MGIGIISIRNSQQQSVSSYAFLCSYAPMFLMKTKAQECRLMANSY